MKIWGNPILPGFAAAGDLPLLTREAWNALPTAAKQAYGLVAIQDKDTDFVRGQLVYGGDYQPTEFAVVANLVNNSAANELRYEITDDSKQYLAILKQSIATSGNTYDCFYGALPVVASGDFVWGSYVVCLGQTWPGTVLESFSTGNNWNNQSILLVQWPNYAIRLLREHYSVSYPAAYSDTYQADEAETLYAYVSVGGVTQINWQFTSTGNEITLSSAQGSGARSNYFYRIDLSAGDTISFSYGAGGNSTDVLYLLWK